MANNNEKRAATGMDVENSTTEVGDALVQMEERRDKKSDDHYIKTRHTIIISCACVILIHLFTILMLVDNGSILIQAN